MRSTITLTGLFCVAVLGLCGIPRAAHAQGYPTRPITVVVPFPAGGPSDVVARIVAEQMGKVLGQTLVIENVGGAGGTIGSARVASASPDGYTLLAGSMGSHVSAPVLTPNVKYDSSRDFEPIGFTAHAPAVIVARKDFPANDLRAFLGQPEEERRGREAGAWRHRRLLAHGLPAVHGGDRHQADARRLSRNRSGDERPGRRTRRFLLRAGGQRSGPDHLRHDQGLCGVVRPSVSPRLPNVPTAKELGVDYQMSIWAGIFAPKGVSREIVEKLAGALDEALDDPAVAEATCRPWRRGTGQERAHAREIRCLREGRDRALVADPQGRICHSELRVLCCAHLVFATAPRGPRQCFAAAKLAMLRTSRVAREGSSARWSPWPATLKN